MSSEGVRKNRAEGSEPMGKGRKDRAGRDDEAPANEGSVDRSVCSRSPDETERLGRRMGVDARPGTVICLFGELGSGKTKLTQGIARGLGVPETYAVTSPTFTLVNEYPARLPLIHVDLFRISSPDDLSDLGWEEYIRTEGVVVIEWAERAGDRLPEERIEVRIAITGETERRFDFTFFSRL